MPTQITLRYHDQSRTYYFPEPVGSLQTFTIRIDPSDFGITDVLASSDDDLPDIEPEPITPRIADNDPAVVSDAHHSPTMVSDAESESMPDLMPASLEMCGERNIYTVHANPYRPPIDLDRCFRLHVNYELISRNRPTDLAMYSEICKAFDQWILMAMRTERNEVRGSLLMRMNMAFQGSLLGFITTINGTDYNLLMQSMDELAMDETPAQAASRAAVRQILRGIRIGELRSVATLFDVVGCRCGNCGFRLIS